MSNAERARKIPRPLDSVDVDFICQQIEVPALFKYAQENWGTKVHESADGRSAIFVRDFGKGNQIFTFVFWAR